MVFVMDIYDEVWEAMYQIPACAILVDWPSIWRLTDEFYGGLDLLLKVQAKA